jgi:hypothetical protein
MQSLFVVSLTHLLPHAKGFWKQADWILLFFIFPFCSRLWSDSPPHHHNCPSTSWGVTNLSQKMFGSLPVAYHATTFIWWPAVASHDFMVIDITHPCQRQSPFRQPSEFQKG